jgi:glycyl-tRNA synthetase beta chain
MSACADLLIEIGMEELPPKALVALCESLVAAITQRLDDAGIPHGETQGYASPRRLAVLVQAVATRQLDQIEERRGPMLQAAFDANGKPTKAALGFARSCDTAVEALERLRTDKGEWLLFKRNQPGRETRVLLPSLIADAVQEIPTPRRMTWGSNTMAFVRPVHWLVVLLGPEVVPMSVFGISSGRVSRGHRFHHPAPLPINEPGTYLQTLMGTGRVMADHRQRRTHIETEVRLAATRAGGVAEIDADLVDEVNGLVEWPVALVGHFESHFLKVPSEALISSMQGHQKYFPVRAADSGELLPVFIMVTNIDSLQPAAVIRGNERVIRPRLADAEFFWNQDRQTPLSARVEQLRAVTYQQQLGSQHDKATRVARLAGALCAAFGVTPTATETASMLAKCDLLTEMVGEFPELQGIMGRYYALHDGIEEQVASAIEQHYWPRFSGDRVPDTALGALLGVADRIDTLCGIFAIGKPPTGDKDPFALRRGALAALRILTEGRWSVSLVDCLRKAVNGLPEGALKFSAAAARATREEELIVAVYAFMIDRFKGYYLDKGYSVHQFESVRNARPTATPVMAGVWLDNPVDFDLRMVAVRQFSDQPEVIELSQMNKRIRNILRKADFTDVLRPDPSLFRLAEERALQLAVDRVEITLQPLLDRRDYVQALGLLTSVRPALAAFFDRVMVMDEEVDIRVNRLRLLVRLASQMTRIVDLSELDPA